MTPGLHPCPACAELVQDGVCACPFCGAKHPCASRALPAAALTLGLVATGAACFPVQSDYKAPSWDSDPRETAETATFEDADGDGYTADVDCDDADPLINPGAAETPNDATDSNCDGYDNT